ncbi:YjiH family protein [Oceanimonas sp. NS1]|nr:YjiH family protein [Oceanimonas sp. NS1]
MGILIFLFPSPLQGKTSIPLDHMVGWLRTAMGETGAGWYAMAMILAGAVYPLIGGQWRRSLTDRIFLLLKWLGVIAGALALTGMGPAALQTPDMLPFLFNKLVISVGLIVPLGSVFLAFLVGYGLLEAIGILVQKLMRPIWRTPGRSAIDAVASFVGSYSIGLLITNRVYGSGHYSAREAAIIATGFSTVSATFMIIVAKTLDLMDIWNQYFWLTLVITLWLPPSRYGCRPCPVWMTAPNTGSRWESRADVWPWPGKTACGWPSRPRPCRAMCWRTFAMAW